MEHAVLQLSGREAVAGHRSRQALFLAQPGSDGLLVHDRLQEEFLQSLHIAALKRRMRDSGCPCCRRDGTKRAGLGEASLADSLNYCARDVMDQDEGKKFMLGMGLMRPLRGELKGDVVMRGYFASGPDGGPIPVAAVIDRPVRGARAGRYRVQFTNVCEEVVKDIFGGIPYLHGAARWAWAGNVADAGGADEDGEVEVVGPDCDDAPAGGGGAGACGRAAAFLQSMSWTLKQTSALLHPDEA